MVIAEEIAKAGFQDIIYDIGSDHAHLPIYLVKSGLCGLAAATDISPASVVRAAQNAAAERVADKIQSYTGDGFTSLADYRPGKIVVCAGIGGKNLAELIYRGFERASAASRLILQPMNSLEILREWLLDNMFSINYERLAREGGRIYSIMFCNYAGVPQEYARSELYAGRNVVYTDAGDYLHFLKFTRSKILNRYNGLIKSMNNPNNGGQCGQACCRGGLSDADCGSLSDADCGSGLCRAACGCGCRRNDTRFSGNPFADGCGSSYEIRDLKNILHTIENLIDKAGGSNGKN